MKRAHVFMHNNEFRVQDTSYSLQHLNTGWKRKQKGWQMNWMAGSPSWIPVLKNTVQKGSLSAWLATVSLNCKSAHSKLRLNRHIFVKKKWYGHTNMKILQCFTENKSSRGKWRNKNLLTILFFKKERNHKFALYNILMGFSSLRKLKKAMVCISSCN